MLGSLHSWSFINPTNRFLEVHDWNSLEWLGLFAEGAELGAESSRTFKRMRNGSRVFKPDRSVTEAALREAGIKNVIGITPPLASDTAEEHAAKRLLEPLRERISERAYSLAIGKMDEEQMFTPMLRVDDLEFKFAQQRLREQNPEART